VPENIHERTGIVSHDEARKIAQKFIDAFFNNPGKDRLRATIPADPQRDDDIRLCAYIAQQKSINNWQPVKTAPRDGTEFLAVWKTGVMGVVSSHDGEWMVEDAVVGGFMFWMQLPEPPKEAL